MAGKQTAKPLLPTLKEKKRYITYQLYAEGALPQNAGNLLLSELKRFFGVQGAAKAGLLPILYDAEKQRGIIKTSLAESQHTRAAMLLTSRLDKQQVMVRPVITSGILKKAKQAM